MAYLLKRNDLARRYLFATIVVALVPLILVSVLYDRYSKQLIDSVFESRIEGDLDAVAAQMNSFLVGRIKRLENIVDLPDTARFFLKPDTPLDPRLLDFLLLEAEGADIYAIELFDNQGNFLTSVPTTGVTGAPISTSTPMVSFAQTEVIGPVLPTSYYPGWFLIRQPVVVDQVKLGTVAFRMRLASLTEQMAPLSEAYLFKPQLTIFNRIHLSPTGAVAVTDQGKLIQRSQNILPGWHLDLISTTQELNQPGQRLRLMLLGIAITLAVILSALFVQLSKRLDGYLSPLKAGAAAVAQGDFSTPIPENAPGELGALALAFNSMRQQLRGMINSRVETERRATLGNMAAGIAHEIRNPLATVNTALYGLRAAETEPERLEMYEEISDEILRVDQTIGEFLEYARPSQPNPQMVRIRDVFQSLRTLTAAQLMDKGVTLNLSGESGLCLLIDAAHLRQILLNLILNALAVLAPGGNISLRVYRDNGATVLEVTDNGPGMDPHDLSHCLQPFFTKRAGGTGLGLPITVELVRSNGGCLKIVSAPNEGVRVCMRFEPKEVTS